MNFKTRGIVIKRMNFGEADKILTIFTERFGKIKAISKGVRRIKSHLAGSLEPFMVVDFELHEGKSFFIVTGASIIHENIETHNSLKKIAQAFYVGELIDRFFEEGEKSVQAFTLLANVLTCIESSEKEIFVKAYCLKLLDIGGFKPELFCCVHCKSKVLPNEIFWDETEGGVICPDCQGVYHHGRGISTEVIKLLRFLAQSSFDNINCLKVNKSYLGEADLIISSYIQGIIEKELKSKKFIAELSLEGGV